MPIDNSVASWPAPRSTSRARRAPREHGAKRTLRRRRTAPSSSRPRTRNPREPAQPFGLCRPRGRREPALRLLAHHVHLHQHVERPPRVACPCASIASASAGLSSECRRSNRGSAFTLFRCRCPMRCHRTGTETASIFGSASCTRFSPTSAQAGVARPPPRRRPRASWSPPRSSPSGRDRPRATAASIRPRTSAHPFRRGPENGITQAIYRKLQSESRDSDGRPRARTTA